LIKGKTLGTIETGEWIDIFMDTYEECCDWGLRTVYIEWIED
jgi:3D (Asp-Asp-Asp) domain-containing protein